MSRNTTQQKLSKGATVLPSSSGLLPRQRKVCDTPRASINDILSPSGFQHDFSQVPIRRKPAVQTKPRDVRLNNIPISHRHPVGALHAMPLRDGTLFTSNSLTVGMAGDRYEKQADQVAERVMRMTESGWQVIDVSTQRLPAGQNEKGKAQSLHPKRSDRQLSRVSPQLANQLSDRKTLGQPLPPQTQSFMESRFGHDFSHVKVHTDSQSARMNQELSAQAFTHGSHIYYGAGRAPAADKLTSHELTHVVQQTGSNSNSSHARVQRQPASAGNTGTAKDQKKFIQESIQFLDTAASFYLSITVDSAKLIQLLAKLKRTVESSQSMLNGALKGDQALQKNLRSAYQSAVSALVKRAATQLNKTTHEIYQTHRDRIHEWGWPQAITDPSAHAVTAALPEFERKRLKVITTDFSLSNLNDLFSTKGGRTTVSFPTGVTESLSGAIPKSLQHGLKNVAATLMHASLSVNSTTTLALDLEKYGGDYSAYRFTYVEHRRKKGRKKRSREVIIERLGSVGIEGISDSQRQLQMKRFEKFGFQQGSGWSAAEFESLPMAIAQIPDSLLTPLHGLTFSRASAHATNLAVGGDYNPNTHTLTMYDRGFSTSLVRFGTPGQSQSVSTNAARSIIHEIGHAIDLQQLQTALQVQEQANAAFHEEFKQYEKPLGSGKYRGFPLTKKAKELNRKVKAARKQVKNAHPVSRKGKGKKDFRKAARRDKGRFPTNYPNPDPIWQEYFAESFSLYISNPNVLKQMRPNVYQYFVRNFPM